MKFILTIAITVMALSIANAQIPATKGVKATVSVKVRTAVKVRVSATAAEPGTSAPVISAKYVGTNDLNLYLLREGVKKA